MSCLVLSIVDTFQTPKISSQHESFAKLMLIWHVHKGSQQPSSRSVGRICISSIPYHSPFLEPILCLVLQQNNWRQQSMMLFKWGIMHKPSPSWGGVLSGQDTALSSNIMSWLWSASDDGRRRVSSETDSMAHPLSTVLAHYRSPSWQRRRRPDNHWMHWWAKMHSSWQINHSHNDTPAMQNKCQIYNCFLHSNLRRMSSSLGCCSSSGQASI